MGSKCLIEDLQFAPKVVPVRLGYNGILTSRSKIGYTEGAAPGLLTLSTAVEA